MKSGNATADRDVSRREFVRLAMMSSAVLMSGGLTLEGQQLSPHAQLRELAPGAVRPEGWLRGMLAAFPDPVFPMPPRAVAERSHNVVQYTTMPFGGHYPFYEAPDLLIEDLQRFRRSNSSI